MNEPFIFIIFGGTGHLSKNKLMPALYFLSQNFKAQNHFKIISIGRRPLSRKEYLLEIEASLKNNITNFDEIHWALFSKHIDYLMIDLSQNEDYLRLKAKLSEFQKKLGTFNTLYYYATAPEFFPIISKALSYHGLNKFEFGYQRVVIEKPFGYDLKSATSYNQKLYEAFEEKDIFRIDHYLGKEMIQNIFFLRFTNIVFEKVWNHDSIKSVQIIIDEKSGIEKRGEYYDRSGALRDMVQNHMLQTLSLIGMDTPADFSSESILIKKLEVLKKIEISRDDLVFGQYEGYLKEKNIPSHSSTETFIAMKCHIRNERWRDTPFYLRTGKKMNAKSAEIIIEFKENACCYMHGENKNNMLVIKIQPEEGVYFRFNAKEPGVDNTLKTNILQYCQSCQINYRSVEAYEKLLNEVITGDRTLFASWEELKISWEIIDQIDALKSHDNVVSYPENSNGPVSSDLMMLKNNTQWMKDVFI
jgi:glucose-6-phosphate 1-dehydrogenase